MARPITVRLDDEEEAHLRATAAREDVTLDDVISRLVRRQMEYDVWFAEKVQEGIDAADRGELVPHERVVEEAARRRAEFLARKP